MRQTFAQRQKDLLYLLAGASPEAGTKGISKKHSFPVEHILFLNGLSSEIFFREGFSMGWGIVCGLFTALLQDFGYVFSRIYILKTGKPGTLLIRSQILMGGFSLLILPFLFFAGIPDQMTFLMPMLLVILGSACGQFFFFRAERYIESSRISSMMGLRVILLALISAFFLGKHYHLLQWLAILLAAGSAFLINWESGHFRLEGMGQLALSLGFYCISDLSVAHMIHGFGLTSLIVSSLFGVCLVNILTGLLMLVFSKGMWTLRGFSAATPFAVSWICKQFCLYVCYALIGPVHGNVILSVRGPLSIVISLIRQAIGVSAVRTVPEVWLRRGIATLLMAAAVVIYSVYA